VLYLLFYLEAKLYFIMNNKQDSSTTIKILQKLLNKHFSYWVLFKNGTCVVLEDILPHNELDIGRLAKQLLISYASTQKTIFTCNECLWAVDKEIGWIIPVNEGIYSFIPQNEFIQYEPSVMALSVQGRNNCLNDCEAQEIIYISSIAQKTANQ